MKVIKIDRVSTNVMHVFSVDGVKHEVRQAKYPGGNEYITVSRGRSILSRREVKLYQPLTIKMAANELIKALSLEIGDVAVLEWRK